MDGKCQSTSWTSPNNIVKIEKEEYSGEARWVLMTAAVTEAQSEESRTSMR